MQRSSSRWAFVHPGQNSWAGELRSMYEFTSVRFKVQTSRILTWSDSRVVKCICVPACRVGAPATIQNMYIGLCAHLPGSSAQKAAFAPKADPEPVKLELWIAR